MSRRNVGFHRRLALWTALSCALLAGCRTGAPPSTGTATPPRPDAGRTQLNGAAALVQRGCYDCMREGLAAYESLRDDATIGAEARDGAVRTALLLAVRETELGLLPGGYIERARQLLGPVAAASPELAALVDIAEVVAGGPTGFTRTATTDKQFAAMLTISRRQEQWAAVLLRLMPQDLAATYLWMGLACGPYSSTFPQA
ncbi:MAG: hypothetical protein ABMA15_31540, partial [Vicinamibacterales bacterium]